MDLHSSEVLERMELTEGKFGVLFLACVVESSFPLRFIKNSQTRKPKPFKIQFNGLMALKQPKRTYEKHF